MEKKLKRNPNIKVILGGGLSINHSKSEMVI